MEEKKCSCEPRILVVDDNQFNIMVIKNIIEEYFGLDVEEATNGEIALQLFEAGMNRNANVNLELFN